MTRISVYMAGAALSCVLAFSTPVSAQLLPDLGVPGLNEALAPVVETVTSVTDPVVGTDGPAADVVTVTSDNGNVDVTVLGGDSPLSVDAGDTVGIELPVVTINLPDTANIVPEIPGLPDLPDIINNDDDPDITINNPPALPGDPDGPTIIIVDNNGNPGLINGNSTNRSFFGSNSRSNGTSGFTLSSPRKGKLAMLLALLQNRGWMNFVKGRGVCLPPYGVVAVRDLLSGRDERRLEEVIAPFANDIAQMRAMMANCRSGPRLQAQDINRVIAVGVDRNGTPMLYVL